MFNHCLEIFRFQSVKHKLVWVVLGSHLLWVLFSVETQCDEVTFRLQLQRRRLRRLLYSNFSCSVYHCYISVIVFTFSFACFLCSFFGCLSYGRVLSSLSLSRFWSRFNAWSWQDDPYARVPIWVKVADVHKVLMWNYINSCSLGFNFNVHKIHVKSKYWSHLEIVTRHDTSRAETLWMPWTRFGTRIFGVPHGEGRQLSAVSRLRSSTASPGGKSRGGSRWVQAFFFLDYLWCFVFFVICGSLGLGLLVGKLGLVLAQCLIISLETFHRNSKTKRITLANEYKRHKLHSPMLIYSCWGGVLQRNLVNAWWFDWCVAFCVALLYRCVLHFEGPDDCALVENLFSICTVFCWESCCVFLFASVLVLDSSCDFETTSSTVLRWLAKCWKKVVEVCCPTWDSNHDN